MSEPWTYNSPPGTETTGPRITAIALVFSSLSFIIVSMRLYVRMIMLKAFGPGLENVVDMPAQNLYTFGLLQYAGAPFYITSILGFKISLLLSYLRFIPKGIYRWATLATMGMCIAYHIAFLVVQLNLCTPLAADNLKIAKQWDPTITNGSCIPGVPFYTSMASLTIFFDIVVMLLPFPVLAKSQIQKRKKFVLLGCFGLGAFITVIQIIRIQTVHALANYLDSAPLIMWSAIENNLGIIVCCIPTLAPLVQYFNEKSRSGSRSNKYGGGSGYGRSGQSGNVGSRYALQSWRPGMNGMQPLSSGTDRNDGVQNSRVGKGSDDESADYHLDAPIIMKKTEFVVTSDPREPGMAI
ncbi:satratoxin biosynthesis SC1 cluster protein 4 [Colletotrichum spaethianum]|uniref:Satratoxin biosynthesis SC1 cluster protein 4 n=1 Tax=Colletotrichum spaethianum TaxID=700344 RepID=A0AA37PFE5_9PEZI|nr:satratoxin biosynthesis SC1 cluster protein 4 [Colletotrichum spaethianum]GKT51162.1 satratoxin biosynthesis SC1 cluster protein 4 [Colletotrichum spaethianum]